MRYSFGSAVPSALGILCAVDPRAEALGYCRLCLRHMEEELEGTDLIWLDVGGLADPGDRLRWVDRRLKRGDVVSIKVIEAGSSDKPRERRRPRARGQAPMK